MTIDKNGNVCENEYDAGGEPLAAALFTTGNGYMGVRGSFEEFGSLRVQGAFVRGFIDEIYEICEPFAGNEYMKKYYLDEEKLKSFEKQESCVNMHDFLFVRVQIGGETFYPWEGKLLSYERYLDPARAVLVRRALWQDGAGRKTELLFERFASFACRYLYCQRVTVTPVNHGESVRILSGVDALRKTGGQVITAVDFTKIDGDTLEHAYHAVNKYNFAAQYRIKHVFPKGRLTPFEENGVTGIACACEGAQRYVLEKFTYLVTSRDTSDPLGQFLAQTEGARSGSYEREFAAHAAEYARYFEPMDVKIEGDREADAYLRFASYHTAISACREDGVHGVAAKGLTGERYNQFVWWDCEIHQLPFFLATAPETAKKLLEYRYNLLEASRKNAKKEGFRGAKYAFCSSVAGDERVWQYARHPFMQVHINSDIPFGILHYYDWTGDQAFMRACGIEIIEECLRFWCGRVKKTRRGYEILQVTGTDEHHPYVDNDAYTNYCVQYIFRRYLALIDVFGASLAPEERALFEEIAQKLYLPVEKNGLIPQFDGYFSLSRTLEEAGGSSLKQFQMKKNGLYHKSQIIKQPDVALLYTLADVGLEKEHYAQNWDYYEHMCETSSSLTFPVHAIASADNGRAYSFYTYFMQALKIDVDDLHGVGWQGVHSGCLAGGYLSILRGVFGVRADERGLHIAPNAMPLWKSVRMQLVYRGRKIGLYTKGGTLSITLLSGEPCRITVDRERVLLENEIVVQAKGDTHV